MNDMFRGKPTALPQIGHIAFWCIQPLWVAGENIQDSSWHEDSDAHGEAEDQRDWRV
jgi:hypothetical protein